MTNNRYRAAAGIVLATAMLLVWMNGDVATEDDSPGGLMFLGVLVGGIGAVIARFWPQGMALALFAAATGQAVAAVIAISAWGNTSRS